MADDISPQLIDICSFVISAGDPLLQWTYNAVKIYAEFLASDTGIYCSRKYLLLKCYFVLDHSFVKF